MQGHQNKSVLTGLKAYSVRGSYELFRQCAIIYVVLPFFRDNQFSGKSGHLDSSGVEQVGHAFPVTNLALVNIRKY